MSQPRHAMRIQLDPDQTQRLMDWAGKRTAAEVEEACEPSGYTLEVHFWALGPQAEAVAGVNRLDLGDVSFELVDEGEP